ncbi:MAG: Hydrolase SCO5215, alpha/beta fold family, partial [uncultured Thermoleophilia bacterium]
MMGAVTVLTIDTPSGPARAHLHPAPGAAASLVLGHGAGGGVAASDLVAVTRAATRAGVTVVLVEQPYRMAGRRSPPPAARL